MAILLHGLLQSISDSKYDKMRPDHDDASKWYGHLNLRLQTNVEENCER